MVKHTFGSGRRPGCVYLWLRELTDRGRSLASSVYIRVNWWLLSISVDPVDPVKKPFQTPLQPKPEFFFCPLSAIRYALVFLLYSVFCVLYLVFPCTLGCCIIDCQQRYYLDFSGPRAQILRCSRRLRDADGDGVCD